MATTLTFIELNEDEQILELQRYLSQIEDDAGAAEARLAKMEGLVNGGRFVEAVDFLLEQAPVLFSSEQTTDGMIGNFFHLVVYLSQAATSLPTVLTRIVELVRAPELGKALVQLSVLNLVYNTLPSGLELRFETLNAMISLAVAAEMLPLVKQHLLKYLELVEGPFAGVGVEKKRAGLAVAADALSSVGARAEASALRVVLLNTYEDDGSGASGEATEVVLKVVADSLDMDDVYKFDHLLELAPVAALAGSSNTEHALVHQVLSIFVTGFVSEYTSFYDGSADARRVVDTVLSLNHERNIGKMRLLSLASLAADTEIIPYSLVAATLDIDTADVEAWGIKINKAKLARVRMDQATQVMHITRATQRVFERKHWELLRTKLSAWRDACQAMLDVVANA